MRGTDGHLMAERFKNGGWNARIEMIPRELLALMA